VLGFFHLGKDEEHIGLKLVETWSESTYVDALLCATDVVRRVRRGEFFELGRAKPFEDDWIFRALVGKDLLHAPFVESDEEGGA
jgi:hypothetical protein